MKNSKPILVAGATGYVGGRLTPVLLEAGYSVRAMGRSLEKLACRPWGRHPNVELVKGDVLDRESLERALSGCGAAYYLVHSMIAQKHKFVEADRKAAQNMVSAAESAGVDRIIYLGGLAEKKNGSLSNHLRSRIEVTDILQSGKVPGEALLEFKICSVGNQYTDLEVLSRFLPKGLWGMIYWYTLYPFHEKIFFGMLKKMAKAIE